MERKHWIILAVAVILIAIVGSILAGDMEFSVNKVVNESEIDLDNVSDETADINQTTDNTNSTNNTDDDGWVWSGQQDDYIKDFTDSDGNEHIIYKSTGNELVFMKDGSVFLNGKNITDEWDGDLN